MQPQAHPRATWASGDDNGGFYLIVIGLCACVGAYLLWTWHHGTISSGLMWLLHQQIGLIRWFTQRYDVADRQLMHADPEGVTLRDLSGILRDVGVFFRIPAGVLMLVLAVVCMARAAPSRFRRAFDLDGLIREQADGYPATEAFVNRRLGLVAPAAADPRPSDYALTAEEWIARYATGAAARAVGATEALGKDGPTDEDEAFSDAVARRNLVRQLGPRWRGLAHASPQVRCLFAAFAMHLDERRAEAAQLLGDVSRALRGTADSTASGPEGPLAFPRRIVSAVDAGLLDYGLVAPALAHARRHAYTHTALMGLLTAARAQAGVLAPCQFAWLKLVDRPLWYALHSLGFETEGADRYMHPNPRTEAAGARDHWSYERLAGEPVLEPSVDRALAALRKVEAGRARRSKDQVDR